MRFDHENLAKHVSAFVLFLLLGNPTPLFAQGTDPLSGEELARIANEAAGLAAEVSGQTFPGNPPEVVVVDRAAFRGVLDKERVGPPGQANKDAFSKILGDAFQEGAATSYAAKYSFTEGKVYLCAENFRETYPEGEDAGGLLLLILGHEFLHALDDSSFAIGSTSRNRPTLDEMVAYQALVEGHATWLETRIASRLGLTRLLEDRRVRMKALPPESLLPRFFLGAIADQMAFPYEEGEVAVTWILENRGPEALGELFRNPPRSTAEILRPELAVLAETRELASTHLERRLAVVEEEWAAQEWSLSTSTPTAFDLFHAMVGIDRPDRRRIAGELVAARAITVLSKERPLAEQLSLSLFRFLDSESALEAHRVIEASEDKKDEILSGESSYKLEESLRSDLELGEGTIGVSRTRRIRLLGVPQRVYNARAVRGSLVVVIQGTNFEKGEAKALELALRLLETPENE